MTQLHTTWQILINDLTVQRNHLIDSIRNYPPPIPACDAQFNYLLEKRDRITVELHRLQRLESNLDGHTLNAFIEQSGFISDTLRQSLGLQKQA